MLRSPAFSPPARSFCLSLISWALGLGLGPVWAQEEGRPLAAPVSTPAQPSPGQSAFEAHCAACHAPETPADLGLLAPTLGTLQAMPPERIYDSLVTGRMQAQGAGLSEAQKQAVAAFLGGRALHSGAGTVEGHCVAHPPLADVSKGVQWAGWGNGPANRRFQSTAAAGLTAAQVPHLALQWAFGLPGGASSYSQPTLAGGRLYFGSDNATVYSVDARSGCLHWSFRADAGVRSTPVLARMRGRWGLRYALYVASIQGTVYALDAQNGQLLWKVQPGEPRTVVTGSLAYYEDRLFVPYAGTETLIGADPRYPCCSTRGMMLALDARSGRTLWRTSTIPRKLISRGRNAQGTPLWGPAGGSIWSTPTVDVKRQRLYVTTGNSYTWPAASTTDAVLALEMTTGRIAWHRQQFHNDIYIRGCPEENPDGGNCPPRLGRDWDLGGTSPLLHTLPDGRELLIAASKNGTVLALDPAREGLQVWRTRLYEKNPPGVEGMVIFGAAADEERIYFPLQRAGGGLAALRMADGHREWTAALEADARGLAAPATVIPGVVFTGGWDGVLRAVSTEGKVMWTFDTRKRFETVNGVAARGGSLGATAPVVGDGWLYVSSGYVGLQNGTPGNVILGFAVK